ncbi:MAG TPA: hypothetical protein VGC40_04855, partial [Paenirhodobacter sp.]
AEQPVENVAEIPLEDFDFGFRDWDAVGPIVDDGQPLDIEYVKWCGTTLRTVRRRRIVDIVIEVVWQFFRG